MLEIKEDTVTFLDGTIHAHVIVMGYSVLDKDKPDSQTHLASFRSKEDAELFVRAKLMRAEILKSVTEAFVKQIPAQPDAHHFADNDGRCVFCGLPRGSMNLPLKCQPMTPTQNEVAAGRYLEPEAKPVITLLEDEVIGPPQPAIRTPMQEVMDDPKYSQEFRDKLRAEAVFMAGGGESDVQPDRQAPFKFPVSVAAYIDGKEYGPGWHIVGGIRFYVGLHPEGEMPPEPPPEPNHIIDHGGEG